MNENEAHTYPQVAVSQVRVVVSGVGAVDGLFAVNLNHAAVLNVPRVLQLIEDVPGLVFDQQSCAGRPENPYSAKQSNSDEPSQRLSAANDQRSTVIYRLTRQAEPMMRLMEVLQMAKAE